MVYCDDRNASHTLRVYILLIGQQHSVAPPAPLMVMVVGYIILSASNSHLSRMVALASNVVTDVVVAQLYVTCACEAWVNWNCHGKTSDTPAAFATGRD